MAGLVWLDPATAFAPARQCSLMVSIQASRPQFVNRSGLFSQQMTNLLPSHRLKTGEVRTMEHALIRRLIAIRTEEQVILIPGLQDGFECSIAPEDYLNFRLKYRISALGRAAAVDLSRPETMACGARHWYGIRPALR
ncbi:MAG: hypothetical protein V1798_06475 [Pseudomonadota bacterium]